MDPFLFSLLLAWMWIRYASEDVISKIRGEEAPRHADRPAKDGAAAASTSSPEGDSGTGWFGRIWRRFRRYFDDLWQDAKSGAEQRWDERFSDDRGATGAGGAGAGAGAGSAGAGTAGDPGFDTQETPGAGNGGGSTGPGGASDPPPHQPPPRQTWTAGPNPPPSSDPYGAPPPPPVTPTQHWDAERLDDPTPPPTPLEPLGITAGQTLIGGTMSTDVAVASTEGDLDPQAALRFAEQIGQLADMLVNKIDEAKSDLIAKKVTGEPIAEIDHMAEAADQMKAAAERAAGFFRQHVEVQDHVQAVSHVGGDEYLRGPAFAGR